VKFAQNRQRGQILDYAIRPAKIGVQSNGDQALIMCFSGSV